MLAPPETRGEPCPPGEGWAEGLEWKLAQADLLYCSTAGDEGVARRRKVRGELGIPVAHKWEGQTGGMEGPVSSGHGEEQQGGWAEEA